MIFATSRRPGRRTVAWVILLFVLLVIAVVLYPVFDRYETKREERLSCQSNLKMMGLAIIEYSQDNDGKLPNGIVNCRIGNRFVPDGVGWLNQLALYDTVRNPDYYCCPDDDTPTDSARDIVISYAFNINASRNGPLWEWNDPAKSVVLFEVSGAHADAFAKPGSAAAHLPPFAPSGDGTMLVLLDGLMPRHVRPATGDIGGRPTVFDNTLWPAGRHLGGANFLLGDGHVKFFKPQSVSSGSEALSPAASQTGGVTGRAAGTGDSKYLATFSTR